MHRVGCEPRKPRHAAPWFFVSNSQKVVKFCGLDTILQEEESRPRELGGGIDRPYCRRVRQDYPVSGGSQRPRALMLPGERGPPAEVVKLDMQVVSYLCCTARNLSTYAWNEAKMDLWALDRREVYSQKQGLGYNAERNGCALLRKISRSRSGGDIRNGGVHRARYRWFRITEFCDSNTLWLVLTTRSTMVQFEHEPA